MKWATFVKRSTITHIESYPAWVRGHPTMKSIPISSHFHCGIFRGCSNPTGLWCSTFTLRHVSHRATYSVTSRFISYHQYRVFKSLYILVLLEWMEYIGYLLKSHCSCYPESAVISHSTLHLLIDLLRFLLLESAQLPLLL
jgi:hypothetical protein